ncbi:MAG TPA: secondary thiamine-phosphate synthase enzyme YjbQ [candidate division Zixibacteria bacterium]|nr:secondary thiamine-phosphate synthase enzyme YjbQ [candidate division Zixibacteria bacterium]
MIETLTISTSQREEMVDITTRVQQLVDKSGIESGLVVCFVPHTTAAVTINEGADPDVRRDILYKLNKEIPQRDGYHHGEGNSDAHIKSSLFGASEQVLIENGRLVLGTWQAIYFCEFDGPRQRRMIVRITALG